MNPRLVATASLGLLVGAFLLGCSYSGPPRGSEIQCATPIVEVWGRHKRVIGCYSL